MLTFPQGRWGALCALVLSFYLGAVYANTPESEYRQLIRVNEDVQPLGEHPFGEHINIYDGSLSFTQVDVSLPGNGPLLQIMREYVALGIPEKVTGHAEPAFGDWDLVLPHLETLTAGAEGFPMWAHDASGHLEIINGWQTDNLLTPGFDSHARCSNFTTPHPFIYRRLGDRALSPWEPDDWWKGYHLVLPGQGSEDMLANVNASTKRTYPAVTKSHWRFSCLGSTANGQPGEGFLGQAPDGTKYWFDELVYRAAPPMQRKLYSNGDASLKQDSADRIASLDRAVETLISLLSGSSTAHAAPTSDAIFRRLGVLLVTRIEDRFGNSLRFFYDANGMLTGINASDGRSVSLTYVTGTSRVSSVTVRSSAGEVRTWQYGYALTAAGYLTLRSVTLPDRSHWSYGLDAITSASMRASTIGSNCLTVPKPFDMAAHTGTVTHPSGLYGSFTVQPIMHARSAVPMSCRNYRYKDYRSVGSYVAIPYAWYSLTLTRVTQSGAGTPLRTWSYAYSPAPDTWVDCSHHCITQVHTDVTNPDGSSTRYTFSNKYDYTESQLLQTDYYAGAAARSRRLRSETNTYASPSTAPLPASAGAVLEDDVNYSQLSKYSPLSKRVISQDNTNYIWQAEAFNSYAQVTRVRRYSSANPVVVREQTDYLNDVTHWVHGLPTRVTNLTTGEVVDQNVYDTGNDTLKSRYHFGQRVMSYSFNAQGQLASFTDGNNHTTTLDDYKRGIPQAIGYPDGTHQSLAVDDFGQIRSITDQAGATTSYDYDGVGRLTRIDYPSGDEQSWYPKSFSYAFVTGAERGIGGNHWRRTIAKGNQRQVTYFNAELQPVLIDTYINGNASSHTNVRSDYNDKGLTTFSSYPVAGVPNLGAITAGTTSTYDPLGRLIRTQQTSELGTLTISTAYLPGARKQVTDPKGKTTTTTYQVFDEPSYDAVIKVAAPTGLTQTIARNLYGEPMSITQAGSYGTAFVSLTKTLTYDAYHRLCRTTEPESGSEVMAYDGANNLAWSAAGLSLAVSGCGLGQVADAGKTQRTYDAMNRLRALAPPAGTQSTYYGYDALGNLKSAISGISTWSATRNKLGQLTSETLQLTGQDAWTVGYAHDPYGSLRSLTYPDGTAVGYAPDALGRATRVGAFASGIDYFPNGEVASFSYGNGADYLAEQNARQLLSNFSYGLGGALNVSEDYSYDANGNIIRVADLVDGRRNKAFGYDDLNRLTSATANNLWGTEGYTYDPLNNIKSRIGNGATFTYNYDASNRLASITGAGNSSFRYDNRGNVISKNGSTLEFDQKNQLTQIDGLASYAYDAAGRRVMKTPAGGNPTYYFYNQAGQLLYQWVPATITATDFIYLGRKLIARQENLVTHVVGNIDGVMIDGEGNASVRGWACTTGMAQSINVDLYVGGPVGSGTSIGRYAANQSSEAAVASACGVSTGSYRFSIPLDATLRSQYAGQAIYVHGISPVGNGNPAITSSGKYVVPLPQIIGAPTLAAPTSSSTGNYTVSWSAITGSTSYTLQEQVDGGVWSTVHTGADLSWPASGKGNGTYGYRVQACNSAGCGSWSAVAATVVTLPPAGAPTLSVPSTSSTGSYTVSWTAVATATGYELQEQVNGGSWTTLQTGSATSRAISGKGNGTYGYHARACNSSGCGAWSATDAIVVTHPPASAPTLTVPSSSNTGSYAVSWTAVSTATSYTLQEQVNGGAWATIQTGSALSRAISGKANGTYGYHVQACNGAGCSGWSAIGSVTVQHTPATPTGLTASLYSEFDPILRRTLYYLDASWSASTGATSYDFEYCGSGGTCATYNGTTSSVLLPAHNTSYTSRVRACSASGCSAWSASVTTSAINQ